MNEGIMGVNDQLDEASKVVDEESLTVEYDDSDGKLQVDPSVEPLAETIVPVSKFKV